MGFVQQLFEFVACWWIKLSISCSSAKRSHTVKETDSSFLPFLFLIPCAERLSNISLLAPQRPADKTRGRTLILHRQNWWKGWGTDERKREELLHCGEQHSSPARTLLRVTGNCVRPPAGSLQHWRGSWREEEWGQGQSSVTSVCTRLLWLVQGIGRTGGGHTFQGLQGRSDIITLNLLNCSAHGKWRTDGAFPYRNVPSNWHWHVAPAVTRVCVPKPSTSSPMQAPWCITSTVAHSEMSSSEGPLGGCLVSPEIWHGVWASAIHLFQEEPRDFWITEFVASYNGWQWGTTEYMNRIISDEIGYDFTFLNWHTVLLSVSLHFYIPRRVFRYYVDTHFWNISC